MTEALAIERKNLICNFRAPDQEHFDKWKQFQRQVKIDGLDTCRVVLSLTDAYLTAKHGTPGTAQIHLPHGVINIQMNNTFQYQVTKPRREPYSLECVKSEFRRTFSSILFESYILQKAEGISTEFSFRDFLELEHASFRRIVRRLRKKGKIIENPLRTCPRFYILTSRLNETETNTVKHCLQILARG